MAIKIFIDQGHNPVNPNAGAEAFGLREQDITYDVGVRLADLLNSNPEFEAKLSRNTPTEQLGTSTTTSLQARARAANEWGANSFLSLHVNASEIPTASGSEGYVYAANNAGYYLAERILEGLNNATGLQNRGVFARPGLYVLKATNMPSALIEMGYLTNQSDANLLTTDPQSFARGIYNGILDYYGFM